MRRQSGVGTLASLALTCVFGATLLLSLAAGAVVYRRVADRVQESSQDRIGLTYIAAKLHAADAAGKVEIGSFGDGDAVFLYQDYDGFTYETILYVCDGYLMEILCEKGWEQAPEFGETITPAQAFQASELAQGLLRLSLTDGDGRTRSTDVYVRSVG